MRPLRLVVLHHSNAGNATLSYQRGWPEEFVRDRRFDVTSVNLARRGAFVSVALRRRLLEQVDAIVKLAASI